MKTFGHFFGAFAKFADRLTYTAAQLWQVTGPKNDQGNESNYDKVKGLYPKGHMYLQASSTPYMEKFVKLLDYGLLGYNSSLCFTRILYYLSILLYRILNADQKTS